MVAGAGGGGHAYYNSGSYNNRTSFPIVNGLALSYSGSLGYWNGGTYGVSTTQTSGYSFGAGGSYNNIDMGHGAAGGGGGYYGGRYGAYPNDQNYGGPASGGTSYISGYKGSVAITSQNSTTPRLASDGTTRCANGTTDVVCSYHYSGFVFDKH